MVPLQAQVRDVQGTPTLYINGQPHTGLMFWTGSPTEAEARVAEFAGAGIDLLTYGMNWWLEEGASDFTRLDAQIAAARAANPRVLLLLRLELTPPASWREAYPEEMMVHYYPPTGEYSRDPDQVAFTSPRWQREVAEVLRATVAHCEAAHPEVVLGYHLCVGASGEWSYSWWMSLSDFSAPQQTAYRAWLRERYGADAALQAAWGDTQATLETAAVPTDRLTPPEGLPLLDPVTDRRLIDYQQFHAEAVADALLYVCELTKTALRKLGREKLVGIFYGYHFFLPNLPILVNCGHAALARVLASPAVDFIAAPYTYLERHPGGVFLPQPPAGSIRLHGKLLYIEDDTRTFKTKPDASWGRCPDRATTIGVLRRNWLGTLAAGGTLWWMEQGAGWFSDATVLAEIGAMQRITAARLQDARASRAEVAIIVSEETPAYLRYDDVLLDSMIARQIINLLHLGAPADLYVASDLECVFSKPEGDRYRLVVFLDTLVMTPQEREAVRTHVARDGRTLLWIYGAGMITDAGWSAESMAELTSVKTRLRNLVTPAYVETTVTGTRQIYGIDRIAGPVLIGEDPEAVVQGWLVGMPKPHGIREFESLYAAPGLLVKELGESRAVWSALPGLPDPLLRHIATEAGVHVYTDLSAQVLAAGDLLAIHANTTAPHSIRLPVPATINDAFTNEVLARDATEVTLPLSRGDTAVLQVR